MRAFTVVIAKDLSRLGNSGFGICCWKMSILWSHWYPLFWTSDNSAVGSKPDRILIVWLTLQDELQTYLTQCI